jgi:DNA-binding transcriptional regulator LsrR (DeoR family)
MNERRVEVRKRYFRGESQASIARGLGISRQRVQQIVADMEKPSELDRAEYVKAWREFLGG